MSSAVPAAVPPVRRSGTLAGGLLLLLACMVADLAVGRSRGLYVSGWPVVLLALAWVGLSGLAALLVVRAAPRRAAALVTGAALLVQLASLSAGPQLSDDLYRYLWDGRVAAAGIDPYAYPPDAAELTRLHEPFLWPTPRQCTVLRSELPADARADPFGGLDAGPGCTRLNRPSVRTVYPPAAELAFRVGNALLPASLRELRAQLPAALTSLTLTGLLLWLLRRAHRPAGWALLYAAGPLAGLEAGMDSHVDVLGALLGVAAVALCAGPATVRRATLVGAVTASAALVKIYPALVGAVALARYGRSRSSAVCVGAAVLTSGLLYLPHVLAVGPRVFGYLPGYLRENQYAGGQRYLLLRVLGLGHGTAVVVALLLAVVVAVSLRPFGAVEPGLTDIARRASALVGGAMLTVTPGNAWYCSLLVGCAALAGRPEWLGVVAASYVVYGDALMRAGTPWPALSYAAATALVVGAYLRRRVR